MGTGLAYALWFRGIAKLKTSAVAALGLLSPVVATLVGYIFLQQTLAPVQLLGAGTVLASVLLSQGRKPQPLHHCCPCPEEVGNRFPGYR